MAKKKKKTEPNYTDIPTNTCKKYYGYDQDEKALKDELEKYRKNHKKPWYL